MRILVGCEFSGRVRNEFQKRGHDAWSCDLLPSESPGNHIQADILTVLNEDWDMLIVFPDCTYLCSSGIHWNKRVPGRLEKSEAAVEFVQKLLEAPIAKIALENPIGILSSRIRKPDQIIQPYQFGEDASKSTCLWLKNLPKLISTSYVSPRIVNGKQRWGNQTDSGQNKLPPSADRWKQRALTYQGIAEAMANQWS